MAELLEVGVIGRAHGLRGEVSVSLSSNVGDRLVPGASFVTDVRVLTVTAARRHQDRWLVRFESIADRSAAEQLKGLVLRAEPPEGAPDGGFWVHQLVGSSVVEVDGTARGVVDAVEANPASDLLVLDSGALVPVGFVVGSDRGVLTIDPPDGLFDL